MPYEKIGQNEPVCIADEVPFEIPESWEWVRLSDVFSVLNGDRGKNYPSKSTLSSTGIPFISALNLDGTTVIDDDNLLCMSEEQYNRLGNGKLIKDDVVVCIRGSLGKHGRYPFEKGAIASSLVILRPHLNISIISDYIMMYLDTPMFFAEIKKYDNGTAQPNLAAKSLELFFVPIPPFDEQRRILDKVHYIESYIRTYESSYSKLDVLNSSFPDVLKRSILQQAVMGKLVPQDANDEPASVLLDRIRTEKNALIKAGMLKKDRHESIIYRRDNSHYEKLDGVERCIDDEIPYDIPLNWAWCRIKNIFNLQAGKNIQASQIHDATTGNDYPCYGGNGIRGYVDSYNHDGDYPIIGRQGALCGNINRATGKFYATEHAVCVYTYANTNISWACLFLAALNLNQYATATAQPGLAVANINEVLIPVPPLPEQRKIVAKSSSLMEILRRF